MKRLAASDDAKATIATARQMGVSVKMVTGDALAIAQETAKKLGMGANILDAGSLDNQSTNPGKDHAEITRRPKSSQRHIPHSGQ